MNRLTIKELHIVEDMNKALDRLSQLEDIEEELGIDLITLFKALNGAWFINDKKAIYVGSPYLCYCGNYKKELEMQFRAVDVWYLVKDYGKTWALTREELENE